MSMHRVHEIVLPVLRTELATKWPTLKCVSWVPDVDYRTFPIVQVRRMGGIARDIQRLDRAIIELTAYHSADLPTTEQLLADAITALDNMVDRQTNNSAGSLNTIRMVMGPSQFDSPFDDTFRVQALIQLGLRPPRV